MGRSAPTRRTINLALQGGGAHGAFTWGVLDRLLEDGRFRFDAVSGSSAGAVNGIVLAAGLADGGPDAARELLESVWRDVGATGRPGAALGGGFGPWPFARAQQNVQQLTLGVFTRLFSPYQFNPFDLNPLRDILARRIDFDRLRADSRISLLIAATDVETGRSRLFRKGEISADVVLASCCLPQLFQAVHIDGRHYWDGGYSANPPVLPLISQASARDTLIVQIAREVRDDVPRESSDIQDRLQQLIFNQPLRQEIELIAQAQRLAGKSLSPRGGELSRLKRHRLHRIRAGDTGEEASGSSPLTADWPAIRSLRDRGRDAAEAWIAGHFHDIGHRSTLPLTNGHTPHD